MLEEGMENTFSISTNSLGTTNAGTDTPKLFGILQIPLDADFTAAPEFTEPYTLEAMSKLGVKASDLVPAHIHIVEGADLEMQKKVIAQLERRRVTTIKRIIKERQIIIDKLNKKEKVSKYPKYPKQGKKTQQGASAKEDEKSKLPPLKKNKRKQRQNETASNKQTILSANSTNQQEAIQRNQCDTKIEMEYLSDASSILNNDAVICQQEQMSYKKKEKQKQKAARQEQKQRDERERQQAAIKEKTRLKIEQQKKNEKQTENMIMKKRENERNQMMKQEQAYLKHQEKEKKKFEQEKAKRMQRLYKIPQPKNTENRYDSEVLRNKTITSKILEPQRIVCKSRSTKLPLYLQKGSKIPCLPIKKSKL